MKKEIKENLIDLIENKIGHQLTLEQYSYASLKDIGIDSIKCLILFSEIRKQYGVEFPMSVMYSNCVNEFVDCLVEKIYNSEYKLNGE